MTNSEEQSSNYVKICPSSDDLNNNKVQNDNNKNCNNNEESNSPKNEKTRHLFTPEQLLRAMTPIDQVINAVLHERHNDDEDESSKERCDLFDITCQQNFVRLIRSVLEHNDNNKSSSPSTKEENEQKDIEDAKESSSSSVSIDERIIYTPTRRYMKKLILRFVSRLERENLHFNDVEDEDLAFLLAQQLQTGGAGFGQQLPKRLGMCVDDAPDPMESCYVSFRVPTLSLVPCCSGGHNNDNHPKDDTNDKSLLGIKIYPHHNDVGVSRIWEAGCCLAEYLMTQPQYVKNKRVVEFGAGVGLTGLIAAGSCGAKAVHMTDYTKDCLENLEFNVMLNQTWLMEQRKKYFGAGRQHDIELFDGVTTGYLEWSAYANGEWLEDNGNNKDNTKQLQKCQTLSSTSINALCYADVLIAADVVYDVDCIPALTRSVRRFLLSKPMPTTAVVDMDESNQNRIMKKDKQLDESSSSSKTCTNVEKMITRETTKTKLDKKYALFATTYRNQKTFALFEKELARCGIVCDYVDENTIKMLPNIFPCYFVQSRSDVRICVMKVSEK